jgi:hypothetical protein
MIVPPFEEMPAPQISRQAFAAGNFAAAVRWQTDAKKTRAASTGGSRNRSKPDIYLVAGIGI